MNANSRRSFAHVVATVIGEHPETVASKVLDFDATQPSDLSCTYRGLGSQAMAVSELLAATLRPGIELCLPRFWG